MTVIGKTSHTLYFNGVTDSIVCPLHEFTSTGVKVSVGSDTARSSRSLAGERDEEGLEQSLMTQFIGNFSVEAWIRPDCGGVVASKDDLFILKVGSVGSPSFASFSVSTQNDDGSVDVYTTRTANYDGSSYTGITYPTNAQSFIGNNTELSKGTRELIHVAGLFTRERIYLLINGQMVSSTIISGGALCKVTNSDFYIILRRYIGRGMLISIPSTQTHS